MELQLHRRFSVDPEKTFGDLYMDGKFECYTLEDQVRALGPKGEGKIYGKTAIPTGSYKIIIDMSQRFKKPMMRVLDVPHFTGILIHGGNTVADTHGCILVGQAINAEGILPGTSTPAIKNLFYKVYQALNRDEQVILDVFPAPTL